MAIKAKAQITLVHIVDIESTWRYYTLQSSTKTPDKPTVYPPDSTMWSDTEPAYKQGDTNSLYYVDCTVFSNGEYKYSAVSLSTAYESAKEAYNKAVNAANSLSELQKEIRGDYESAHVRFQEKVAFADLDGTNTATIIDGGVIKTGSIKGDRIDVNDLFAKAITATGSISGAKFYGAYIETAAGKIGGFDIGSSYIALGTTAFKTTDNSIYIGVSGISLGKTFSVSKAGVLEATGAKISGVITADDGGNIGGFTVKKGSYIAYNTASLAGAANSVFISPAGISLGTTFKVTAAGVLTATDGSFTGVITAKDGGSIGGFTVKKDAYLAYNTTSLAGAANSVFISPNGLSLGTAFKVTPDGVITATGEINLGAKSSSTGINLCGGLGSIKAATHDGSALSALAINANVLKINATGAMGHLSLNVAKTNGYSGSFVLAGTGSDAYADLKLRDGITYAFGTSRFTVPVEISAPSLFTTGAIQTQQNLHVGGDIYGYNFYGVTDRPKYNDTEIALLSDVSAAVGGNYLPISGGTMTDSIDMSIQGKGYYLRDSEGRFPGVLQNTSGNLWIGGSSTANRQHLGKTYISAGYNSDESKGYGSVWIFVPNASNNGGTSHEVLHDGNFGTWAAAAGHTHAGYAASGHTHNYAGSASAGGAANSANKVNSNLVVKLNGGATEGTNMFTFNGSGAKTINITPAAIGAQVAGSYAAASHTHSYLPLSGGTLTGAVNLANGTWNKAGDDAYFGDNNTAGSFAIKGLNGATNLKMVTYNGSTYGTVTWTGSNFEFSSPADVSGTETITAKFKTSNGGSVSFGKEGPNSGSMLRFDQVDGTCRLRFRGSATAGAIVWEQPEQGAQLYVDLGKVGADHHRIVFPSSAGTLALTNHTHSYLPLSGGTLTGHLYGQYLVGTWLQTTATKDLGSAPAKIAVLDGSGWIYYRTLEELKSDLGVGSSVSGSYLPLSGGTMTGRLIINLSAGEKPLMVRNIIGNTGSGAEDHLYLQYGVSKRVYFGGSTHYIESGGGSYTGTAANANLLDNIDSTGFVRYYNSNNAGLTNANVVNTPSYLHTVSTSGSSIGTITKPSGVDNAWGVLHIHTHQGNYATQLGFGSTTGKMYFRNAYNSTTFGDWKTLLDSSNYTDYVYTKAQIDSQIAAATGADLSAYAKITTANTYNGEQKFQNSSYCPTVTDSASGVGCAFKASRGLANEMLIDKLIMTASTGKIPFYKYTGTSGGSMTGLTEVASIDSDGYAIFKSLKVTDTRILCLPVYENTVSYAANVYVGTNGGFGRATGTSSRTIKHDIGELTDNDLRAEKLYDLNVVQFKYNDGIITDTSDVRYGKSLPGFIIEDMDEKYPIAIDKPGQDVKEWSWNEKYLIPPMLKLIQDQHARQNRDRIEFDERMKALGGEVKTIHMKYDAALMKIAELEKRIDQLELAS